MWRVAAAVAPAALALLVSVGSSMLAFPFFSYIPQTGSMGAWVSQAAFYARLGGDIAGRLLPPHWQACTLRRLIVFAALKALLLPLLLPALLWPAAVGGDRGLVLLVAVNWALSGYVNTGAYLVAPTLVSATSPLRPRVGGFMALSFQISCFLGLMGATALQQVLHHSGAFGVHSHPPLPAAALGGGGGSGLSGFGGAVPPTVQRLIQQQ